MSYIGSKFRISKWVIPHIPTDIEKYAEPFGGMMFNYLKMDLKKYPNLKTVVYNDFNGLNSNLFRCAKDYHRMAQIMDLYPCQRYGEFPTPPIYKERFYQFQKEIFNPDFKVGVEPDFETAYKYVFVVQQCFSGINPATASFIDLKGKYHCKVKSFVNKMKDKTYQQHLDKITHVENLDFAEIIDKYDSLGTFFYVDAPYRGFEHLYSNHNFFGINEHVRLSVKLETILGKFCMSYYRFPELDNLYSPDFFTYFEKDFKKSASISKEKSVGTEILITNY